MKDKLNIFIMLLTILIVLFLLLMFICVSNHNTRTIIKDGHAEILTEIKNSNQIELELIDAVNSAIKQIETDPTNFDCQEVAKFLSGVQRARRNRNKLEER